MFILLQGHVPSTNDKKDRRMPLEEIKGTRRDDGRHRDVVPLNELSTQSGDVHHRSHGLDQLLELTHDKMFVFGRARICHRRPNQNRRLKEHRVPLLIEIEDVILALEVLFGRHANDVLNIRRVPFKEELLECINGQGFLVFLENILNSSRHVGILHHHPLLLTHSILLPNHFRSSNNTRTNLILSCHLELLGHLLDEVTKQHGSAIARHFLQFLRNTLTVSDAVHRSQLVVSHHTVPQ
mmetsp:Transcript_51127/g.136484  ORF Transcript_51127/g.136484 Transcript_51127/m.136484 type:complete len:239 (+) Transcript_51127:1590-2306(+)